MTGRVSARSSVVPTPDGAGGAESKDAFASPLDHASRDSPAQCYKGFDTGNLFMHALLPPLSGSAFLSPTKWQLSWRVASNIFPPS